MKRTRNMLVVLLVFGILSGTVAWAAENKKDKEPTEDEWDILFQQKPTASPDVTPPEPGRFDRQGPPRHAEPGQRRGRPKGPGMGQGEAWSKRGPDRQCEQGLPPGPGFGRGKAGPGRSPVDPVALDEFLREHEPELAEKLKTLREKDPERFRRQMFTVAMIYQPIMAQIGLNPEMGKLSLQKVKLGLRTKQAIKEFKDAKDEQKAKDKAREKLQQCLSRQFDLVIEQEELRLSQAAERLEQWSLHKEKAAGTDLDKDSRPAKGKAKSKGKGEGEDKDMMAKAEVKNKGKGMGRAKGIGKDKGMGRAKAVRGRPHTELGARVNTRKELVQKWRDNKEKIIDARVKELLGGRESFPWGR